MNCSNCQAEIEENAACCARCGTRTPVDIETVAAEQPVNPYATPQTEASAQVSIPHAEGDATGGLIPYKNPKALFAYYMGIFSGLPIIGFPVGVTAFILGILGLRDRRRNPSIKGSVHAWIGIGCGGLFAILWGGIIVMMLLSFFTSQ